MNTERNEKIREMRLSGMTYKDIAAQYGNGYRDGIRDANDELVRCRECVFRQRETSGELYVICERNDFTEFPMDGYCCYGKRSKESEP